MSTGTSSNGISAREARKIAHEVIQMHIDRPAPNGHRGFDRVMKQQKRIQRFMKTGK